MFERDQYKNDKDAMKMKMDELILDLEKRVSEEKRELEFELENQMRDSQKQVNKRRKLFFFKVFFKKISFQIRLKIYKI